jgi:hypothetical protein
MHAIVAIVLLLIGLAAPVDVATAEGSADPARVRSMLSAYESMPPREAWLALGGDAVPILIGIFRDSGELAVRRVRALTALGYFSDSTATQTLVDVAGDEGAPGSFRRAALLALARHDFSTAMPLIERSLAATDPRTRQIAVKALAESDHPEARRMLERHRDLEREPFLIERVERALRSPAERSPQP